jgi:transposase
MDMEQWLAIRRRVLRDGISKRQILRETGMHWETLKKILERPSPPGYQRSRAPRKPKIDPYLDRIRQILEADKHVHKKQRHTAKRIWERLQEEGFTGGYTIVKDAVRQLKRTSKEVYLPLKHPPGEAQGGLRTRVGEDGRGFAEGLFLCDGLAVFGCLFRQSLRTGMHRDVLGWPCAGL